MAQVFTWKEAAEKGAALVASGNFSDLEVAKQVGVSRRTVVRWREHPEFAARVTELVTNAREEAKSYAIADKSARVSAANERWMVIQRIVMAQLERYGSSYRPAESDQAPPVPAPVVVAGPDSVQVVSLDPDLLREARHLEEHAARMLGQWIDKKEEKWSQTLTDEQLERIAATALPTGSSKGTPPPTRSKK